MIRNTHQFYFSGAEIHVAAKTKAVNAFETWQEWKRQTDADPESHRLPFGHKLRTEENRYREEYLRLSREAALYDRFACVNYALDMEDCLYFGFLPLPLEPSKKVVA